MHNRVAADDWDGDEVSEIVETGGSLHESLGTLGKRSATRKSSFAESVTPPRGGSNDGGDDNGYVKVEISFDDEGDMVSVTPAVHGEESDATPHQKRPSSSYGHAVLRRLAAFRGPSRIDRSNSAATHALKGLRFITQTADGPDGPDGRAAAESCFDKEARDGLLHRSKFGMCIGKTPRSIGSAFA
jgi:respiratory burst oxidase